MLTSKEINEVSFGKAGFSGYKPEDVDRFIDQVEATVVQLTQERDAANARAQEAAAKNSETQEKLAILAEKIENYRSEEDNIKAAIISAQKISNSSIEKAKTKADLIVTDAKKMAADVMNDANAKATKQREEAQRDVDALRSQAAADAENMRRTAKEESDALLGKAREEAQGMAQKYAGQIEEKKRELEEVQRQVNAFRSSLLEMYKKHLEMIHHIPIFNLKDKNKTETAQEEPKRAADKRETPAAPQPAVETAVPPQNREPQLDKVQILAAAEQRKQPQQHLENTEEVPRVPEALAAKQNFAKNAGKQSGSGYDRDQTQSQNDIGVQQYADIPESLKKEKQSNFANLKFGRDVDISRV